MEKGKPVIRGAIKPVSARGFSVVEPIGAGSFSAIEPIGVKGSDTISTIQQPWRVGLKDK